MNRVADKVVIVTGAALGLGRASAMMLAREGAKVVLTDIRDAEGEAAALSIREVGGEALYLHHDVSSEPQWQQVMAETLGRFGRLDVLVNNAGVADGCPPEEETLEHWRRLMSVNLEGVFLGTKHAIRTMKARTPPGGAIINLSSIAGMIGIPDLGAYCTSKGGVRLYTKSVALYCAKAGLNIRVNSIHPGYIWTPMVENYLAQHGDVEEGRGAADALHPLGHIGEPDDIAYGVVYLASDESKFMTGAGLVIDGGYTIQ
ncbi:glucose 1-dehydrogenase [Microvirga sp. G4-2]|uniref:glucose 1-dehydrogenase n=1 Tax=Microvirga sp. G4-2 TaxID=3434467 RepID=UPI004043A6C0